MFQLEKSLEEWKRKLAGTNSLAKTDIDELESHLLEEIDSLKKNNLTEEEAFYVACSRIGSVDLLSSEFSKVNFNSIWVKKLLWLLSGYIIISFSQRLIGLFSSLVTTAAFKLTDLSSNQMIWLNLVLNVIFSAIVLILLFMPKYMIISSIQVKFNYLFTYKRWLLVLTFLIFIIIDSIGFRFLQSLLVSEMDISRYSYMILGENIFTIIWPAILCLLFMFLSFKKFNQERTI